MSLFEFRILEELAGRRDHPQNYPSVPLVLYGVIWHQKNHHKTEIDKSTTSQEASQTSERGVRDRGRGVTSWPAANPVNLLYHGALGITKADPGAQSQKHP